MENMVKLADKEFKAAIINVFMLNDNAVHVGFTVGNVELPCGEHKNS